MIANHGWRSAYVLLGGIALLGLPLTALLVRNRPDTVVAHEDHSSADGMTVAAALRTGPFWILACIIMLSAFSENGLVTNLAAILTEHKITAQSAALALSVRGGAGIIGRYASDFSSTASRRNVFKHSSFCFWRWALPYSLSRVHRQSR
jgi:predicted MFS family arabinose efflux permease